MQEDSHSLEKSRSITMLIVRIVLWLIWVRPCSVPSGAEFLAGISGGGGDWLVLAPDPPLMRPFRRLEEGHSLGIGAGRLEVSLGLD